MAVRCKGAFEEPKIVPERAGRQRRPVLRRVAAERRRGAPGSLPSHPMARMTVIYNDTCPICSREVDVYRRDAAAAGCAVEFDGLEAADLAGSGSTAKRPRGSSTSCAKASFCPGSTPLSPSGRPCPAGRGLPA